MATNFNKLARELENKIGSGNQITQDDIQTAAKVARATGRPQDKILYVLVKRASQRTDESE
ncbi:hypothetical protein ACSS6N_25150 [Peribacillus frigoritolerans]|uniref:hypothetical protein n=1 Tax=Peribacillus frigoritolerans TaxID=450367 RepID=UPI003F84042F